MPKENCKYWDKCYQKNEHHLQKYNHPQKEDLAKKSEAGCSKAQNTQSPAKRRSDPPESYTPNLANDSQSNIKICNNEVESEEIETTELRKEVLGNIAGRNYMEIINKRIKLSIKKEYEDLLKSNEFIRHNFLVEMPPDFYDFWKFVSKLKENVEGEEVLKLIEKQFQLQLVGPFEFLAGRFHNADIKEPGDYLRHWRFFYDPPEFQTIFVKKGTGIHYGYWRDIPQDKENILIARNDMRSCEFEFIAGNVFDAFLKFLDQDYVGTPFTAAVVTKTKKALQKHIESSSQQFNKLEQLQKARNLKVVAKTFHRAGIVVPLDPKTKLGYRPLIISDSELKSILKLFEKDPSGEDDRIKSNAMAKLQPIATAASIALDECDFGTSLELGIDLFCSGRLELHKLIQSLLVPAYNLLSRPQFIAISKAHMENRSKSLQLSILDFDK